MIQTKVYYQMTYTETWVQLLFWRWTVCNLHRQS